MACGARKSLASAYDDRDGEGSEGLIVAQFEELIWE
jgi:hypothetical protein